MLAVPLASLRTTDVALAGGKGANLGELVAAGFPVPDGFVLTTAGYTAAAQAAGIDPSDPASARERLRAVAVPPEVAAAARLAYRALGDGAVAVRSSATAEDLPGASFAGQQDTILEVRGEDALLEAIRRCWASLWNARAVAYRASNAVDPRGIALAVVVQRMVDASAAGVLFTADPVAGTRRRAVIDAVSGLGEALVSGRIKPDHYRADPGTGTVLERRGSTLADRDVLELARLGVAVEARFGAPQDIEFALDRERRIWLVQSRPITTLYPLPPNTPDPERDLRVYFSFNVAQGVFGPITPMGRQAFHLLGSALATLLGAPPRDRAAGPATLVDAGMRLWLDLTPALRDPLGRAFVRQGLGVAEARSAVVLEALERSAALAPHRGSRLGAARRILPALLRTRIPAYTIGALLRPDRSRRRYLGQLEALAAVDVPVDAAAGVRLDALERLFAELPRALAPRVVSLVVAAMVAFALARRLLGARAREDEWQTVLRGVAHNPTTEMDLELWRLTTAVRDDPAAAEVVLAQPPEDLAAAYRAGALPAPLQRGLAAFLARYGHRAIAEIDLGVPRWSEDPTHLLGAIANYLRAGAAVAAPDTQFARGRREAEATIAVLLSRATGPRRLLLAAALRRVRALMGTRERPKFEIVRLGIARGRAILLPAGAELASQGRLAAADDIFLLTLPEARRAVAGADLRETVAARRTEFARELGRKRVPRILLSDGTDAEAALIGAAPEGALQGTPASPGIATGAARVILDPEGARLEPGEILVAPSTDPGWTPLFLTAGGLVMEMGGMMSHGAVVAREYGIPAVVGVPEATGRIASGERLTVDGAAGVVSVDAPEPESPPEQPASRTKSG